MDPAAEYELRRTIYRLTQRAVQEATLAICTGPLSPLTEMQSMALRIALGSIIREAVGTGRWAERQELRRDMAELVEVDPRFDEETTEPQRPRR